MNNPKLNDHERKVLMFLGENFSLDAGYFCFAAISEDTRLDRRIVRRACRSLKRKGLAEYARGLWDFEGEPRGSGYGATKKGQLVFFDLQMLGAGAVYDGKSQAN